MKQKTLHIILLGAPGCGKGSLSDRLEANYRVHHFSTGDILYQRKDDRPEVFKSRMEAYYRQTEPLIPYYTGEGKLIHVDSSVDMYETERQVRGIIDSMKMTPG